MLGTVKKISITEQQQVFRDFGKVCQNAITAVLLAPGDASAFLYDSLCNLKLIDLGDGSRIMDFGQVHLVGSYWEGAVLAQGGECLFTSSEQGEFKEWSVRSRALVQDLGGVSEEIGPICD
jgi:hypothetical protein